MWARAGPNVSTLANCPGHTSGHLILWIPGLYRKNKPPKRKMSIKEECPHRRSVHKGELYCKSGLFLANITSAHVHSL